MHIDGLELIPEHCREGVRDYIAHGTPLGSFLTYVFSNDLVHAFSAADEINRIRMFDYCMFLYSRAPVDCWGSEEKVREWIKKRGLLGQEDADS